LHLLKTGKEGRHKRKRKRIKKDRKGFAQKERGSIGSNLQCGDMNGTNIPSASNDRECDLSLERNRTIGSSVYLIFGNDSARNGCSREAAKHAPEGKEKTAPQREKEVNPKKEQDQSKRVTSQR